eukprot:Gb_04924 [translate_table: standard]
MHWWSKSPKKDSKCKSKRSLPDIFRSRRDSPKGSPKTPQLTRTRKLRHLSDDELAIGARPSLDHASDSGSVRDSRSPSPSTPVTRCTSNLDQYSARAFPLNHDLFSVGRNDSGNASPLAHGHFQPLLLQPLLPLPSPKQVLSRAESEDVEGVLGYGSDSVSSDGSLESFEAGVNTVWKANHRLSGEEFDRKLAISNAEKPSHSTSHGSCANIKLKSTKSQPIKVHKSDQRNGGSRLHLNFRSDGVAKSAPTTAFSSPALSPRRLSSGNFLPVRNFKAGQAQDHGIPSPVPLVGHDLMAKLITQPPVPLVHKSDQRNGGSRLHLDFRSDGVAKSAPTTAFSSPALSPRRLSSGDFLPVRNFKVGQAQDRGIPSPVPLVGHNLMAGLITQPPVDKGMITPDRSPLQSPRMRSPAPRSRIHSGAVSPLHPRLASDFSAGRHDDNSNVYPLPLPPGNNSPFGAGPSSPPSPSAVVHRSPGRMETPFTPGKWQKGKLLGNGTFGTVYVGFNRDTGDMCAMKEVPLIPGDSKSSESIKQLEQEIDLLSRLKHPNIVQYYGSEIFEDVFYIYLEYVPGGSINKLIYEYGKLSEQVVRIYSRQILSGLAYLHSMNTVHRDIKGANLLVDTSGRVKLADFGMAKHINGPASPLSLKGSPYWMAPEVMRQKNTGHDLAVDIWSLGCTVIEMVTGKPPWGEYEGAAAMFKVFKNEVPPIPDSLSPEGREFVRHCLQTNPAERPTASRLLDHPFVRNAFQQDNSDPPASATSGIKSLNVVQGPWEKNIYASDSPGISSGMHSGNGKQHQSSRSHFLHHLLP